MAAAGREALLGVKDRGVLPVAADNREASADADGVVSGARDPALCPGGMSRQIGGYNGYTYTITCLAQNCIKDLWPFLPFLPLAWPFPIW